MSQPLFYVLMLPHNFIVFEQHFPGALQHRLLLFKGFFNILDNQIGTALGGFNGGSIKMQGLVLNLFFPHTGGQVIVVLAGPHRFSVY